VTRSALWRSGFPSSPAALHPTQPPEAGQRRIADHRVGNAAVEARDLIVGDRDGVVVVPQAHLDHVFRDLEDGYPIGENGYHD
jgi:regulator of RNase E activity RraA